MRNQLSRLNRPSKFAAYVLLMGMVFQLGACPCGCVEHNVWMQLFGIGIDDHQGELPSSTASALPAADADHHDCTGLPRPSYVDNARLYRVAAPDLQEVMVPVGVTADMQCGPSPSFRHFSSRSNSLAVAHAPSRSKLQVYRL